MIADLLADSSLPQSVTGALKVISDMLSPLLQQSFQRNSFSSSLVTVLEKTQVHVDEASVKDQPDLKDDTPLSLKNVSLMFVIFIVCLFVCLFVFCLFVCLFCLVVCMGGFPG